MKTIRIAAGVLATFTLTTFASAQPTEEEIIQFNDKSFTETAPIDGRIDLSTVLVPTRPKEDYISNTMLEPISAEAKMKFMQTIMAGNPFSVRDMMNFMVAKKKALPGLSFDDVVESLQSKALDLNMRPTGRNTPYIILREVHDPNSPRLEYFSFCDLITMRLHAAYSGLFAGIFRPAAVPDRGDGGCEPADMADDAGLGCALV